MANEVFANGLEIACKAADGKSVACFPDVCFTPPSPPAGWIPIPYANTSYAKDTTNASKTVFISGKPVMKKDISYFKTSTGNEPAAGPKGVFTGVKKGKAYFNSWSMNVMIEGKNVDRHTDLMTHNHGSTPNTSTWAYGDTQNVPPTECTKDCISIEMSCGNPKRAEARKMCTEKRKTKEEKRREQVAKNKMIREHKKNKKEKTETKKENKNKNKTTKHWKKLAKKALRHARNTINEKTEKLITWKTKYCTGVLMINVCTISDLNPDKKILNPKEPVSKEAKKDRDNAIKNKIKAEKKINDTIKDLTNINSKITELKGKLIEDAGTAFNKIFKPPTIKGVAKKALTEAIIGTSVWDFLLKKVPYYGWVRSGNAAYEVHKEARQIWNIAKKNISILDKEIIKITNKLSALQNKIKKEIIELKNIKNINKSRFLDMQKIAANNNCIKARKCNLISYNSSSNTSMGTAGCCPGQTGHHVLPGSMLRYPNPNYDKNDKDSNEFINIDECKNYNHGKAPTVCAEGSNQTECTHGEIHKCLEKSLKKHYSFNKKNESSNTAKKSIITLDAAINKSALCHQETFNRSSCSKSTTGKSKKKKIGCIEAQLRDHYKIVCGNNLNISVRPVTGMTGTKY